MSQFLALLRDLSKPWWEVPGLSRKDIARRFDAIVEFAELEQFIDNQVKYYSSGMYVRLGFAVAVNVEPDILLVDEVLAVGDASFQQRCLDRIRAVLSEGTTLLFVSHDLDEVLENTDEVLAEIEKLLGADTSES